MARHPQPREMAELTGATAKDPQRYKDSSKSELPLGPAPGYMTDEQKACWDELSFYAIPGVLTGADKQILEVVSNLLAEYRQEPKDFAIGKYTHLIGGLARLGMTPSDRRHIEVEKPKDDDFGTLN